MDTVYIICTIKKCSYHCYWFMAWSKTTTIYGLEHTSHNSHVAWKWNGVWPAFQSVCMLVCVWHQLYTMSYITCYQGNHKCDSSSCCVYNHRNLSCKSDIPYPNNYYAINIICNTREIMSHIAACIIVYIYGTISCVSKFFTCMCNMRTSIFVM